MLGMPMLSKPRPHPGRALAVAISLTVASASTASWAEGPELRSYNAAIGDSSISGISSGAFMAVQFGFAWSSIIKGVGVVAGGPFYCAQASAADIINLYALPIVTATGSCMKGDPPPDLQPMVAKLEAKAAAGEIDPLDNVKRQKIYLFHGYNDAVVAKPVTDAAAEFYRRYLGDAARGNLFYQNTRGAGHSFVVREQTDRDINACAANQSPFIDQCGYDQAGIILQHIYGALRPSAPGEPGGSLKRFDQKRYTGRHIPGALSLGDEGYVFVPSACEQGAACRVHIALHGCMQDVATIGRLFIEQAGYNTWADANRIIVLYPQAEASPFAPLNPNGCWDWWSYIDHDDGYVTKTGLQIAAIKAMLDALTAGGGLPPASLPEQGGVPAELIVTDTSDTAAALAWTPVAGASGYRVWRAAADGVFRAVAETRGPSYGDHGLAPGTSYAWQVTALVGGIEGSPSPSARAATRPTPDPCNAPGKCP
jgi:poly(3-hydroxybutyrate) depolymerase